MVVIASLGAELLPGDFILAHCNELTFESMAVCQLIDVILPSSLEVLWWIPPVQAQPLCPNRFVNLLKCKVVELSPSTSSVINNDNVVEVAFVFSAEMLEEMWVNCAGMTQVFFTRQPNHCPFSVVVSESYPRRIWFSIIGLQDKLRKLLSYKRQFQLCQRNTTDSLPLECWLYFLRRLSEHVTPHYFEKKVTQVQHFCDLSMISTSTIRRYCLVRIITQSSMNAARQIFGNTLGVGSRNLPPRKGAPRKVLEQGNKINLVDVPIITDEDLSVTVSGQRIDFIYEELTRNLSIRVKYCGTLAQDPKVGAILRFPQPLLQQQHEPNPVHVRPQRRARAIAVGTSFVFDDKLFSVTASDGIMVTCTCPSDGTVLNLSNGEVWDIIMSSI